MSAFAVIIFKCRSLIVEFFNVGRTWTVKCNPEYDGLILVLSLSL